MNNGGKLKNDSWASPEKIQQYGISTHDMTGQIWYVCGDINLSEETNKLTEAGWSAQEVVVYLH